MGPAVRGIATENPLQQEMVAQKVPAMAMMPDDPFFGTRLLARTQGYFSGGRMKGEMVIFSLKLQTAFAIAAIVFGLFIGIFSGSRLGSAKPRESVPERIRQMEKYAEESFITEISNPAEEQLLIK